MVIGLDAELGNFNDEFGDDEMSEKLCIFCVELDFDYDAGGGGCPTCGYGGEGHAVMECRKHHWRESIEYGLDEYREKIITAKTCKDYKQVKV